MQRLAVPLFALTFAVLAGAAPASADQGADFIEFTFINLEVVFHPEGLPKDRSDDPDGSGLMVHIVNVTVDGFAAQDLRYCIDGHASCPHQGLPGGDNDGQIDQDELDNFQNLVRAAALAFDDVRNLTHMLETNFTVDGKTAAKSAKVTEVRFHGALGQVENNFDPIQAFVDVKVIYDNDPEADRHELGVLDVDLLTLGFEYTNAVWRLDSEEPWVFRAEQTQPASAQARVSAQGWFSSQEVFENSTRDGLVLVAEKDTQGGAESPSLGLPIALGAVLVAGVVAAVLIARRKGA